MKHILGEVITGFWWGNLRELGRLTCRWENNIKTGLQRVGFGGMVWTELAQDRDKCRALVNAVMNFGVP